MMWKRRGAHGYLSKVMLKVMEFVMPTKFKMSVIKPYHERKNPREHLKTYVMMM